MKIRRCTKCGQLKFFNCFTNAKGGRFGLRAQCRECCNEYYKSERAKDTKRNTWRRNTYNFTKEQTEQLLEFQASRCAACGTVITLRTLHIDHDHTTNLVRGLLCRGCNIGLGHFGDNPRKAAEAMQNYVKYLEAANDAH